MKRKTGLITAGSILTLIAAAGSILLAIFLFVCLKFTTEEVMIESYKADSEYEYIEDADGGYYFEYIEDGKLAKVTEESIELSCKMAKGFFIGSGILLILQAVAKAVLAIILLAKCGKKECKGLTIALLALSVISSALVESVLFVIAMCLNNEREDAKLLGLDDININND